MSIVKVYAIPSGAEPEEAILTPRQLLGAHSEVLGTMLEDSSELHLPDTSAETFKLAMEWMKFDSFSESMQELLLGGEHVGGHMFEAAEGYHALARFAVQYDCQKLMTLLCKAINSIPTAQVSLPEFTHRIAPYEGETRTLTLVNDSAPENTSARHISAIIRLLDARCVAPPTRPLDWSKQALQLLAVRHLQPYLFVADTAAGEVLVRYGYSAVEERVAEEPTLLLQLSKRTLHALKDHLVEHRAWRGDRFYDQVQCLQALAEVLIEHQPTAVTTTATATATDTGKHSPGNTFAATDQEYQEMKNALESSLSQQYRRPTMGPVAFASLNGN